MLLMFPEWWSVPWGSSVCVCVYMLVHIHVSVFAHKSRWWVGVFVSVYCMTVCLCLCKWKWVVPPLGFVCVCVCECKRVCTSVWLMVNACVLPLRISAPSALCVVWTGLLLHHPVAMCASVLVCVCLCVHGLDTESKHMSKCDGGVNFCNSISRICVSAKCM